MKNWNNFEIKLKNPIVISKGLLKSNINKFWEDIMNKLNDNQHILFILRLRFENNEVVSVSTLKKIDKNSKDNLIEYLYDRITSVSSETYTTKPIKSIIFSYGIREGLIDQFTSDINTTNINQKYQIFYNNKLPIVKTGNPNEYGKILSSNNNKYTIFVDNKILILLDSDLKNNQIINNIKYIKNGREIANWIDTVIAKNSIMREIGKSIYYYENMELVLIRVTKKSKPIDKIKVNNKLINKIITMDLETVLIDNIHVPYLLSWYDGNITKSYYIKNLDPVTIELEILRMINRAIEDLCIRKYNNYRIYLHNFSKFDGYFLVKYLAKIGICDPIIHKGKIISLNFTYNNYNIVFKDSYLLLPSSLRKLGKSFNVESLKGIFPYGFSDINYKGEVPDFNYFNKISIEEYNKYKDSFISINKI